ncbi:MAG: DUF3256 family protein [Dysgonomonas sp.]|nr:DUF3256 family protein [Dysgonomonas sp.]
MKKIIFTLSLLIFTFYTVSAQEIGKVLLPMPSDIIFGLEASHKDMLLTNPTDTAKVVVDRGTFGELTRLAISEDFISIQTSDAGNTQIKLLPLINDSKIVCVVKTVCGKICDSQIQFYTPKWMPIDQQLIPDIDKDFFIKSDVDRNSQDFVNAYKALDLTPVKMTLSPTDNSIQLEYDIKDYLSEEDYKKIQPFLIEGPKVFTWDKISFK